MPFIEAGNKKGKVPKWVSPDETGALGEELPRPVRGGAERISDPRRLEEIKRILTEREQEVELRSKQEIEVLRRGLGIEGKETQEDRELKRLAEELKENLRKGAANSKASFKVPEGLTNYNGSTTPLAGGSITEYVGGDAASFVYRKLEQSKVKLGGSGPGFSGRELANVLISIRPQTERKDVIETSQEQRRFLGVLWKREAQVRRKVRRDAPVTLADCGITDQENDKMYTLAIRYASANPKVHEKRQQYGEVIYGMPGKLARAIAEQIVDPQKLWKFLELAEPELVKAAPPVKHKLYPKMPYGLVFYNLKSGESLGNKEAGYRGEEEIDMAVPEL